MATAQVAGPAVQLQTLDGDAPKDNLGAEHTQSPLRLSDAKEEDETLPSNVRDSKQRWNHPRKNMLKVFAAFISFSIIGANDGAYGVKLWPEALSLFNLRWLCVLSHWSLM